MGPNEKVVFWICVIVSMAIALSAVAMALPRTNIISFDYQGVFVAIFAALVTILIGWQIFNTIGIMKQIDQANQVVKAAIENVKQIENRISTETDKLKEMNFGMYYINTAVMSFFQYRINNNPQDFSNLVTAYVLALRGFSHILHAGISSDESIKMFNLGNGIMSIVITKLEEAIPEYKQAIKAEFDENTHRKADGYFYKIASCKELLGDNIWNSIESLHHRRTKLRVNCGL